MTVVKLELETLRHLLSGDWYTPFLEVNEGEEYLLLINSYQGGNDSFTLEWTGDLVDDGLGNPLDCSIVVGDLGPDQEVCEGEVITLDGTSPSTTAIGYQWFLDTGTGFTDITGETNPIYDQLIMIYQESIKLKLQMQTEVLTMMKLKLIFILSPQLFHLQIPSMKYLTQMAQRMVLHLLI